MNQFYRITRYFGVVLFVFFLISPTANAAEKVYSFRAAHYMAPGTPHIRVAKEWCAEIEKQTKGRVKITLYPGGVLVPVLQTYDAVVNQTVDIGFGAFTYYRGRFPLTEVIDLPLGYKNAAVPTRLVNEYYKKFRPKEMDDTKVLYLEAADPMYIHLTSAKPVTKLEDMKGLKIRSSGVNNKIIEALGAVPVSIPVTDSYEALSKGVAQGTMSSMGGIPGFGLQDVIRVSVEAPAITYTAALYTVMNKDQWNSLPADLQTIIDKVSNEFIEKVAASWVEWENAGRAILLKKGHTFVKLSQEENARWADKMKPLLAEYANNADKKGLPGSQALKFCQDYLKANDK